MKKLILCIQTIFLLLSMTFLSYAANTKLIQFSFVLSMDEAEKMAHTKHHYVSRKDQEPKEIFISRNILLSNNDIDAMIIIRKENSFTKEFPSVGIIFNEEGSKKLAEITAKNTKKSLAVVVGGEVLSVPVILLPITRGYFLLTTWRIPTNEAARDFVTKLGFPVIYNGEIRNKLTSSNSKQ